MIRDDKLIAEAQKFAGREIHDISGMCQCYMNFHYLYGKANKKGDQENMLKWGLETEQAEKELRIKVAGFKLARARELISA